MDDHTAPRTTDTANAAGTGGEAHGTRHEGSHEKAMYARFALMILTSTVVMFLLTYTNVYVAPDIHLSRERVYMAILMGGAMALVMLGFMWGTMYKNLTANVVIVAVGLALAAGGLFLSRTQAFIGDEAYMKGMIPHHSIAILTSERADIDDVRVRILADEILVAQRREIQEMEWLLDDIDENGVADTQEKADARPVPVFQAQP